VVYETIDLFQGGKGKWEGRGSTHECVTYTRLALRPHSDPHATSLGMHHINSNRSAPVPRAHPLDRIHQLVPRAHTVSPGGHLKKLMKERRRKKNGELHLYLSSTHECVTYTRLPLRPHSDPHATSLGMHHINSKNNTGIWEGSFCIRVGFC
jgi:hypothetical protein